MYNPFKTPAHEKDRAEISTPKINVFLLLLSVVVAYMLAKDLHHLLSIHNVFLIRSSSISPFHYIYLSVLPFEISYFRISSSIAMLVFILFIARNNQIYLRHNLYAIIYGATQLAYQILAIAGVIGILQQISIANIFNLNFLFDPKIAPSAIHLLLRFVIIIAPPVIFLLLCIAIKSEITKLQHIQSQ